MTSMLLIWLFCLKTNTTINMLQWWITNNNLSRRKNSDIINAVLLLCNSNLLTQCKALKENFIFRIFFHNCFCLHLQCKDLLAKKKLTTWLFSLWSSRCIFLDRQISSRPYFRIWVLSFYATDFYCYVLRSFFYSLVQQCRALHGSGSATIWWQGDALSDCID